MNSLKTFFLATAILFSFSVSQAEGPLKADKQAIETNCTQDATTAGCGTDKVGTGLLKCLYAYKKANKTYKFTDGCKTAMQQFHADRRGARH